MSSKWTFWIDCGGTFTDIVAVNEHNNFQVHKLLSHSPHYESVVIQGIRNILGHDRFSEGVAEVRLGTTVATNAFLENKGEPCALVTTLGQRDVLEIRQQNRPDLFAIDIRKIPPLYRYVTHIQGRMNAQGKITESLDLDIAEFEFQRILDRGIESLAISLMHSTVNPEHEIQLKKLAIKMGFKYISLSHEIGPFPHYISRTETAVVDATLTPFLKQYTDDLERKLGIEEIYYMKSDGGLCLGGELKGHNSLLSGPAGGLIGAIKVAKEEGINNIISFDMGGTSTDVAIYQGELKTETTPEFHGLKLHAPMVDIHTVAAGGGSILKYDNGRFIVGPESASAFPGPACYRNGGPLTITDANLYLGRINIEEFPNVFGPNRDQSLDKDIVETKFKQLSKEIGLPAKDIAKGFLDVAVETMSRAIRKISVEAGLDPKDFTLVSFGGAGGQLVVKVAESLKIKRILIHPLSSVLSAYGIGQASHSIFLRASARMGFKKLENEARSRFSWENYKSEKYYLYRISGSDHILQVQADNEIEAAENFRSTYQRIFNFWPEGDLVLESLGLKVTKNNTIKQICFHTDTKILSNYCVINENNTSIVLENGWNATKDQYGLWVLNNDRNHHHIEKRDSAIELEIFYQRFQFIAEQMGFTLKKLAHSVNIKERHDFSCALFTATGELIANAPHIPVHLGSMGDVVTAIINEFDFRPGDSFISNSPHYGGTHLPDVTLVTPVYFEENLVMWVASRGHHADIGGITPGSMPGESKKLTEEGVIIGPTKIASGHELDRGKLRSLLTETIYPVRNYSLNENDIQAKLSANLQAAIEIKNLYCLYGTSYVGMMSEKILSYSQDKILEVFKDISPGSASKSITNGRKISISLSKNSEKISFSFVGTSKRQNNNFNTPIPVVKACVLFVLRSLIKENIPLNSGIMRAVEISIPQNSMLSPGKDSAVVAGNVETSQSICDLLFEVLKVKAHSQGTMNNLSFGNETYQYYETIGGGSGASLTGSGTSGIQVNMTNSLLTDPEVLESRFPVVVELMGLRHGSGGDGRFQGGDGIYRRIKFLESMEVSMLTQSRINPPEGIDGGSFGKRGINLIETDGQVLEQSECFTIQVRGRDRVLIETPGGGGYGPVREEMNNLVFSFGSNLDLEQIKSRCPSVKVVCRGRVFDKEMRYTLYSSVRGGGVADMTDSPGGIVYGLVLNLSDSDLKKLDKIECGDNCYQRITVDVYNDNGEDFLCYAYDVIDKKPDIPPTKIYEWLVYSGAYCLNTPVSYLKKIKSFR
jgi:5-oxoprolinase (ATP-hydrolysing)